MVYQNPVYKYKRLSWHTDLTTGPLAMTVVLKLNGPPAAGSLDPDCAGVPLSTRPGLRVNDDLVGLQRSDAP